MRRVRVYVFCVCALCVLALYIYFDISKSMFEAVIDIHASNMMSGSEGKRDHSRKTRQDKVRERKGKPCGGAEERQKENKTKN